LVLVNWFWSGCRFQKWLLGKFAGQLGESNESAIGATKQKGSRTPEIAQL